jgi:GT2 family glycosyltransferase
MNAGIRAAIDDGARFLLLLTHDARLQPGTLDALLAAAGRAPDVGILGPALWSRAHDRPWSYGAVGAPWEWPTHRAEPPAADAAGVADCEWVDGSVLLVRRELFEAVGLFEDRYFMYFEEPDLCLRARRAGWRVGVAVDAMAEQSPGVHRRRGAYIYLDARNGLEFARRLGGARCALARARVHLGHSWRLTKWYAKDFRDPRVREEVHREVAGTMTALAHFARRRWGPPPGWLPGLGDVET